MDIVDELLDEVFYRNRFAAAAEASKRATAASKRVRRCDATVCDATVCDAAVCDALSDSDANEKK